MADDLEFELARVAQVQRLENEQLRLENSRLLDTIVLLRRDLSEARRKVEEQAGTIALLKDML